MTSPLLGIAINDAVIFSAKSICLSYLNNGNAISHWWAGCAAGAAQERESREASPKLTENRKFIQKFQYRLYCLGIGI